jgi:hypothetical protein
MERPPENNVDAKSKLELWLLPLLLFGTFSGVVLSTVESVTKFTTVVRSHFYLAVTVLWLATVILAWNVKFSQLLKTKLSNRVIRLFVIVIVTTLYLFSIGWTYYEYNLRQTGPAETPDIQLSRSFSFLGSVHASELQTSPFTIASFYLNDDLCSFTEGKSSLSAPDGRPYRSFAFNNAVHNAFSKGQCVGVRGNRAIDDVIPVFLKRLERTGQEELKTYIDTQEKLSRVITQRGDVFAKVMFTGAEIREMKDKAPADFEVVKEWLLSCVGIYQPVLTLVVKNSSKQSVTLSQVVYQVLRVEQVMGGATGPLYPSVTYDHTLEHRVGDQRFDLNPAIQIQPGDSYAFNLRIFPAVKKAGLVWLLKIKVVDTSGNSAATETVEIIMSK